MNYIIAMLPVKKPLLLKDVWSSPNAKTIPVGKIHFTHANSAQSGWCGRDQSSCRGDANPELLAKVWALAQPLCSWPLFQMSWEELLLSSACSPKGASAQIQIILGSRYPRVPMCVCMDQHPFPLPPSIPGRIRIRTLHSLPADSAKLYQTL